MTTPPRPRKIVCDVGALAPDAGSLDALARLQLTANREGLDLRLSRVSRELLDLLELAGLTGVLRVEAGGQSEQREKRLGVEEERHLDDPAL
jgi:STAS domain